MKTLFVIALSLLAGSAFAAIDPAVTAAITDTQTDLTTVGAALIGLAVLVMGLKWVKAMFF